MLIDWFTVGAQALNFIVLIWLMKRFLYKPIVNSIEAREKLIAQELADAALKKAEAKKSLDEFQEKNEELEKQRATILTNATEAAKVEGGKLLDEARQASDLLRAKRMESLRNEASDLSQSIESKVQQEVFEIARKTLKDLSNTSLEERMCEVFAKRLREVNGATKETLGMALMKGSEQSVIRSAFELPVNQKTILQNALNEIFSADVPLRYETDPKLVCGIELIASGQKVAWSIDNYLSCMKESLDELLTKRAQSDSESDSKPAPKQNPAQDPKAVSDSNSLQKPVAEKVSEGTQ